jgi:hypothetical protein
MPLGADDEAYGTNADGSKNEDYCRYCFVNGKFTADCTMDEMIEFCVPHMVAANSGMSAEEARSMMKGVFPALKRWQQNQARLC